jgi:hypothetical protein
MKGCGEKIWMENTYFTCGEESEHGVLLCDRCRELLRIVTPISNFLCSTKKFENDECDELTVKIIKKLNQSGYKIVDNDYTPCDECDYLEECIEDEEYNDECEDDCCDDED